ncbi:MAG: FAD-dependent 5-carboxymethylaminomethyl-2-thiouridine(34) oxidoreductase MnmC [Pseudomonadota bacterium]
MTRLPEPDLEADRGTLRSRDFDDIYYSPDDGLSETEHVFINGNDLKKRLGQQETDRPFVIGELGFGTGLNVLAACRCFEKNGHGSLNLWSVEGFPLSQKALAEALSSIAERWPAIAPWAEQLAAVYPNPAPGQTQVSLGPRITLTLAFGDVRECLINADFRANAWFLDGFAPSRNPAMWADDVIGQVGRLTKSGGTAATFSVASGVRDALQKAGFAWEKAPGFGRKKHMLRARLEKKMTRSPEAPWYARPTPCRSGEIAIIGAGIAGAAVAYSLFRKGRRSTVFGAGSRHKAASSNPAGLIMPRLDADDTPAARFYRDAFLEAVKTYSSLRRKAFTPCGGSTTAERSRFVQIQNLGLWPDGLMSWDGDRVWISQAGTLDPSCAVDDLLARVSLIEKDACRITQTDGGWMVQTAGETNHPGPFAAIVLATGAIQDLWPDAPITPSLGQLDVFDGAPPACIMTDGHYVAPLGSKVLAGATYAPFQGGPVAPTHDNSEANRRAARSLLGFEPGASVASRAALRATTPDRHPIVGPLYDKEAAINAYQGLSKGRKMDYPPAPYQAGLYAFTGLGSRGLVTAPLLGAHLAAMITDHVSPLPSDIAALVHPGRFLIRDLKRGKISP